MDAPTPARPSPLGRQSDTAKEMLEAMEQGASLSELEEAGYELPKPISLPAIGGADYQFIAGRLYRNGEPVERHSRF